VYIFIYLKKPKNVEYLNYSGSKIPFNARCTHETESRIVMARAAFNKRKVIFGQQIELKLEE
jgi:hypothetical protein